MIHTPNEHNQLRKGRAVALLIHYKNRLLDERGLPDEDTLTDLLTDQCHAHTPAQVGEALRRSHLHHHAEVAATPDDPEGDAPTARYVAIREAALAKFAADGIDCDESPVLAFPDNPADNGCSVQTWTWFSFVGTPFDIRHNASVLPAKTALHPIGTRVSFTGYRAASHDYPALEIGHEGVVKSVRRSDQIGFDYWVDFSGQSVALNASEVALVQDKPDPAPATDSLPAEGDDLCDQCMSSGVQVARTDHAGATVCADCDTVSLPADKAVWCIFARQPDTEPAWHDEHGMPVTYPTKRAAELEIIDTLEELFQQVKAGERELGDVWGDEDWIEPVTLHPDGTITTEIGATYGRRDDHNEP